MSQNHTPGPWLDWNTLEWLVEPQRLLANTTDARLIGAAPELLEALDWLMAALRSGTVATTPGLYEKADAAIAKATGAA